MNRTREFFAGMAAELPLQLGVIPFGMIFGALAVQAGLSPLAAQLSSMIVFAGSAQLALAQLIAAGAAAPVTILTCIVLNLRHLLYSAALAPEVRGLSARWRLLLAYLLTDEAFAIGIGRYRSGPPAAGEPDHRHWFFLGAGVTLWLCWQASTAIGVHFGTRIPPSWGLDFAVPLTFLVLAVAAIRDRACLIAASASVLGVIALHALPLKLGLVAAIVVGVAAGAMADQWMSTRESEPA